MRRSPSPPVASPAPLGPLGPLTRAPPSPSSRIGLSSYTYGLQYRSAQSRVGAGPLASYNVPPPAASVTGQSAFSATAKVSSSSTTPLLQQQQQPSNTVQSRPPPGPTCSSNSTTTPATTSKSPAKVTVGTNTSLERPTTLQPPAPEPVMTPGPVFAPGLDTRGVSPDYCLSCPPNHLRFSDAMRAKQKRPSLRRPKFPSTDSTDSTGGDSGSERDYIGFATLPEQVHRKSVKRGFEFTLMVVGESGLGKSTLVNSLFLSDLYKDRVVPDAIDRVARTTSISRQTMDIEERGVRLRLSVVDTPGFGDALDCDDSWRAVCSYVDQQFSQFFQDESGLHRKNIQDNRVHCCLYFVPPYGHGLRQLDVEFMKRLQNKVNLVPVVAKADTLTAPELKKLKQRILTDIEENGIQIYQFPDCDSDEDEEFKKQDEELKKCIPFAVVASNVTIEVNGRRVRGRQYPWGVVEVDNPIHSDFARLRSFLVSTHMQDLKDVTHDLHYEAFRAHCISQISQQAMKERGKIKRDSVGMGLPEGIVVTETDRLLLEKDEEIRRMQDMLAQMQQKLHKQNSAGSREDGLNELTIPSSGNQRDSVVDV